MKDVKDLHKLMAVLYRPSNKRHKQQASLQNS